MNIIKIYGFIFCIIIVLPSTMWNFINPIQVAMKEIIFRKIIIDYKVSFGLVCPDKSICGYLYILSAYDM